jgi:TatA/E family protein of Tat protein translocase
MPGMGELIVILLIVMVVFGAKKLPGIGDALGKSIRNFKRASAAEDDRAAPALVDAGNAQLEAAPSGDEDEWEEVVVRRKKA